MRRSRTWVALCALVLALIPAGAVSAAPPAPAALAVTPIQIFGAWHCSDDACLWGAVRTVAQFDSQNHWLVDRGDGRPSVNLVVLSFVNPLRLLNLTTDAATLNGVPRGMTQEIVNYFTSRGIRVMFSIGGITYTDDWDSALAANGTLLGQRAAAVATQFGVGIEIDYEQNTNPNLVGLQSFISAYRAIHPYNASGSDPTARLTIDTAAGDRWLIDINRKATADWLRTDTPVLDFANAMVSARQPSASTARPTGRSTSTASRSTTRWCHRWHRRSSPAASTSPRAARFGRSAPTTTAPSPRRRRHGCSRPRRTVPAPRPGCSGSCSGRRRSRPHAASAPRRPTPARAVWASARRASTSPSRCRRCGRADLLSSGE
ncbi:hypothetical protein F4553_001494 [Allocatelliglobosispora scoriae]|uniref:GH18 domain-containing protein n=1 Tax=Allocatelliglobosispora scoriae TaxID=643052 RepID=A0A841BKE6_9ACTN|nr:hypothetical protein [Allocatelliglobosispora scoriae]MBB5868115.1 hypothetical protein [Allocatelliglobosispora scoriae]